MGMVCHREVILPADLAAIPNVGCSGPGCLEGMRETLGRVPPTPPLILTMTSVDTSCLTGVYKVRHAENVVRSNASGVPLLEPLGQRMLSKRRN